MTDYTEKYLKYKEKYLQLKEQYGGVLNFGPTQTATYDPTASPSEFNLSSIRSESPSRELKIKPTPKPTSTTKTVNYYYNHYLDPLYPRYIVSDYVVPYNRTPLYPPIFDVPVNTFDYYGEPKTTKRTSKRRSTKRRTSRKSKRKTSRKSKRKSRR